MIVIEIPRMTVTVKDAEELQSLLKKLHETQPVESRYEEGQGLVYRRDASPSAEVTIRLHATEASASEEKPVQSPHQAGKPHTKEPIQLQVGERGEA